MAKPVLPTDYKDDVLNPSMNGKRKYNKVQNPDGTFSLEDVTQYDQTGSTFGAKQLNDIGKAFNDLPELKVADNCTTTEPGFVLDARQGKNLMDKSNELSRDLGGLSFGQDADGNWGYKIGGADPVIPFKPDLQSVDVSYKDIIKAGSSKNYNVKEHPHLIIIQASTGTSAGTEESNNWLAYSDGTYGMEFLLTRGNGTPIDIHVVDGIITITAVNLNISLHDLYYM